jgi:AcrR family transcriptional regulator
MVIQADNPDTRNKILAAALKLFSERGFHATTTRIIAKYAGVNEVTLFRLFKTKLQLFSEILEHIKQVGFDPKRLDEIDLPPAAAIRFVIDSFLEIFEMHPKEFRIMYHAILDQVEQYETEFVGTHQAKMIDFLTQAFTQLRHGNARKDDFSPRMHAQVLISTLLGLSTGRVLTRTLPIKQYSRQEIGDYVAHMFLDS